MSLAAHVRTLGRGPGRSRALTQAEAAEAMALMLSGEAAPEAIGALLMLLRMKGETPEEIAGFAAAAQAHGASRPSDLSPDLSPVLSPVDLDWPSYAAGRTRGAPWFLLAARLVAQAGYRVLLHGWNGPALPVRAQLAAAGIPLVGDLADLEPAFERAGIAYVPLEVLNPGLFHLLSLREVLGLRSCINTVARMTNPAAAPAVVQGVFHPAYRALQAEAAHRLGWRALTVIKGGGGEMERHPGKVLTAEGLRDGAPWAGAYGARAPGAARLADLTETADLAGLWSGDVTCPQATEIVIGTAAIALDTLGAPQPDTQARTLWQERRRALAA